MCFFQCLHHSGWHPERSTYISNNFVMLTGVEVFSPKKQLSMYWFKGKITGNHWFSHQLWGFPVNFPLNQSIDHREIIMKSSINGSFSSIILLNHHFPHGFLMALPNHSSRCRKAPRSAEISLTLKRAEVRAMHGDAPTVDGQNNGKSQSKMDDDYLVVHPTDPKWVSSPHL